jgi:hypothetical protein
MVAEAAAEHALKCGASSERVEEMLWSKEPPNHGKHRRAGVVRLPGGYSRCD